MEERRVRTVGHINRDQACTCMYKRFFASLEILITAEGIVVTVILATDNPRCLCMRSLWVIERREETSCRRQAECRVKDDGLRCKVVFFFWEETDWKHL